MSLPSPATGTELFLAAILDELQTLRGLLEQGGRQAPEPAATDTPGTVSSQPQPSAKRTRTRTPRAD